MRTTIDIDDDLTRDAMTLAGLPTKRVAVAQALQEFVARRQRHDLRDLFGEVTFTPGYDCKALREGREP
ncbi:MAG: type II toxin-antitoxin system VapB family antitoxin [Propionibacteriaceae bacterium]|jgi:Arc/MetJ family transcription regulator|nr:type II toxin-antitoxin system VapB family antitoxin [Propionibacteriaceae bacterium]